MELEEWPQISGLREAYSASSKDGMCGRRSDCEIVRAIFVSWAELTTVCLNSSQYIGPPESTYAHVYPESSDFCNDHDWMSESLEFYRNPSVARTDGLKHTS